MTPNFSGIIGHAAAKQVLARAAKAPRPGYLICGLSGLGCHTLAEAFVRALLGIAESVSPLAAHPDAVILARGWNDAKTALKKEIAVREVRALRTRVAERPVVAKRVVAYFPEADFLNEEGVNALLKSVEEPPAGATFVLVAHDPGKIPATLISRLQRLALYRVTDGEVEERLRSGAGFSEELIAAAVAIAEGRPGVALRYCEDAAFRVRMSEADRAISGLVAARTPGEAFACIAAEAARCDASEDPVLEWRETLHLWSVALRRRIGTDPSRVLAGIGNALAVASARIGGPVSPRITLELGLNRVVSGRPLAFPGWTRSSEQTGLSDGLTV